MLMQPWAATPRPALPPKSLPKGTFQDWDGALDTGFRVQRSAVMHKGGFVVDSKHCRVYRPVRHAAETQFWLAIPDVRSVHLAHTLVNKITSMQPAFWRFTAKAHSN